MKPAVRRIDVQPLLVIDDFSGYHAPPNNLMDVEVITATFLLRCLLSLIKFR